jgi:hypothetical protein
MQSLAVEIGGDASNCTAPELRYTGNCSALAIALHLQLQSNYALIAVSFHSFNASASILILYSQNDALVVANLPKDCLLKVEFEWAKPTGDC